MYKLIHLFNTRNYESNLKFYKTTLDYKFAQYNAK